MEIIHALYKLKIETTDHSSSQGEEEDKRNWVELPPDVMSMIFLKLGTVDILGSAQWVCSSWWKLSKQPHLFQSIHVEKISTIFGYQCKFDSNFMAKLSEGLAREAIDRSCGQLVEFSARAMCIDELLLYMSEKSSSLRSLRLVEVGLVKYAYYDDDYGDVTDDEFIGEIAIKLPHLEELEFIKCSYFSEEVIKTFGRFCPQLKSCRFNCFRDKYELGRVALAIAKYMPELHHLNLFGNLMRQHDLRAILDGCQHLESLDLRRCFKSDLEHDLKERCKNIKVLRLPNDPTDDFEYDYSDHDDSDHEFDDRDDDYGMPNDYYETDHWSR